MGAQPEIKAVAEQLQELNAQKPPFRKTPALLLGDVTKILLQGLMPQNQGFTKQSAYLRAADVKSIAKGVKTGLVIMDEIGPWPPERKGS